MKLPKIGDIVAGRYEVERVVARGGMGMVYAAKQRPIGRLVAMKVILPDEDRLEKLTGRFRREVELAMQLRHPNVVEIYDFGRDEDGLFYLVMEYLEGLDLKELLETTGPLPLSRASEITLQILDALSEAHANEIVHRDLKPSNIFVTRAGRRTDFVKLLDFGVAKSLAQNATDLTQTGQIVGSLHYMSPENFIAEGVNYTADVYAAGLIFLEMLLGQRVMQGTNTAQLLMLHLNHQIKIPPPFAGTPLEPVILRACARDPKQRYPNAESMYDALEAALQGLDLSAQVDEVEAARYVAVIDAEGSDLDHMAESMRRAAELSENSGSEDPVTIAAKLVDASTDFENAKTTLTPSQPQTRGHYRTPAGPGADDRDVPGVGVSPHADNATVASALPERNSTASIEDQAPAEPRRSETTFTTADESSDGLPAWAPWAAVGLVIVLTIVGVVLLFQDDAPNDVVEIQADEVEQTSESFEFTETKTPPILDTPDEDPVEVEMPEDEEPRPVEKTSVFVQIETNPRGAAVEMDGRKIGKTPMRIELDREEATLEFSRRGYRSRETVVSRQDADDGISIELEEIPREKKVRKDPVKDRPRDDSPKDEKKDLDDILKVGKFE